MKGGIVSPMDPLSRVSVALGGRVVSVRELVEGWVAHVRRLEEEHIHPLSELPSAWVYMITMQPFS